MMLSRIGCCTNKYAFLELPAFQNDLRSNACGSTHALSQEITINKCVGWREKKKQTLRYLERSDRDSQTAGGRDI